MKAKRRLQGLSLFLDCVRGPIACGQEEKSWVATPKCAVPSLRCPSTSPPEKAAVLREYARASALCAQSPDEARKEPL